ncbi:hypothetical protein PENANT_c062G03393 [Penicillium antarcticum]|uniref:Cyclin-dependent kinase 1 n=1 Tax=Penicillium antarcticum TaxID=416450 RepID=A0A1V6PQX5_9EURO|nr:hypothetical protein PENANT_c062G03393 [Penicillium antarcticum]
MNGIAITPSKLAKLLGVIFDHELRQKEYVQQVIKQATHVKIAYGACSISARSKCASCIRHAPATPTHGAMSSVDPDFLCLPDRGNVHAQSRGTCTANPYSPTPSRPNHHRQTPYSTREAPGTYGVVYKTRELNHFCRIVALKKIRLEAEDEGDLNIVQLLDIVYADGHNFYLVIKFLDLDFKKYIEALPVSEGGRGKPLPDESTSMATLGLGDNIVKKFMAQLVEGTRYYYSHCILHCDLKPQNLLFGRDGNLKLADFGLARAFGVPLRTCTYESVDASFAEIYNCKPLFPSDSDIDEIFKILR